MARARPPGPVNQRAGAEALRYFGLVFALSAPLWVLGAAGGELFLGLPVSALQAFVPVVVAVALTWRERGGAAVGRLLASAVDIRRLRRRIWLLPTLLLMPVVLATTYAAQLALGRDLPAPHIPIGSVLGLFVLGFLAGVGEEAGWMGYAAGRLQARMNALPAAVLLGVVWSLWHVVPFVEMGRDVGWMFWHSVAAVAARVLIFWIHNSTGGLVLMAVLFHDVLNIGELLYPDEGSHYDPVLAGVLTVAVAAVVVWRAGPGLTTEPDRRRSGRAFRQDRGYDSRER